MRWHPESRRRRRLMWALTAITLALFAVLPVGIAFGNSFLQELGFVLVLGAVACQGLLLRAAPPPQARPPFRPLTDAEISKVETDRAIEYAAIKRRWLRLRERGPDP